MWGGISALASVLLRTALTRAKRPWPVPLHACLVLQDPTLGPAHPCSLLSLACLLSASCAHLLSPPAHGRIHLRLPMQTLLSVCVSTPCTGRLTSQGDRSPCGQDGERAGRASVSSVCTAQRQPSRKTDAWRVRRGGQQLSSEVRTPAPGSQPVRTSPWVCVPLKTAPGLLPLLYPLPPRPASVSPFLCTWKGRSGSEASHHSRRVTPRSLFPAPPLRDPDTETIPILRRATVPWSRLDCVDSSAELQKQVREGT